MEHIVHHLMLKDTTVYMDIAIEKGIASKKNKDVSFY